MGAGEPESWPFKPGRPRATIPLRERYRGIKLRCLMRPIPPTRLEKETAAGWAPSPAGVTSLVGSRWDGGILFPPRDRRKSWSDRLCDHVPDTSPEARRGAGREDQRRAPGIGLSEQERVVPGQSVSGRLGVGGRRFCAGTTGPAGRRPGDAVVESRTPRAAGSRPQSGNLEGRSD
jgi:hypothetical protein